MQGVGLTGRPVLVGIADLQGDVVDAEAADDLIGIVGEKGSEDLGGAGGRGGDELVAGEGGRLGRTPPPGRLARHNGAVAADQGTGAVTKVQHGPGRSGSVTPGGVVAVKTESQPCRAGLSECCLAAGLRPPFRWTLATESELHLPGGGWNPERHRLFSRRCGLRQRHLAAVNHDGCDLDVSVGIRHAGDGETQPRGHSQSPARTCCNRVRNAADSHAQPPSFDAV